MARLSLFTWTCGEDRYRITINAVRIRIKVFRVYWYGMHDHLSGAHIEWSSCKEKVQRCSLKPIHVEGVNGGCGRRPAWFLSLKR